MRDRQEEPGACTASTPRGSRRCAPTSRPTGTRRSPPSRRRPRRPDEEGGHVVSGIEPIRASISVRTDPARAFEVFTGGSTPGGPWRCTRGRWRLRGRAQGRAGRLRGARGRAGARAPVGRSGPAVGRGPRLGAPARGSCSPGSPTRAPAPPPSSRSVSRPRATGRWLSWSTAAGSAWARSPRRPGPGTARAGRRPSTCSAGDREGGGVMHAQIGTELRGRASGSSWNARGTSGTSARVRRSFTRRPARDLEGP